MNKPANNFSHVTDPAVLEMLEGLRSGETSIESPVASAPETAEITPYFAADAHGIALYQADALELLQLFPAESFDLIFADPPYFLSSDGITCQSGKRVSVNKGAWDKPTTFADMHEFNQKWLRLCHRLLKPNGTLWVTGTSHNIYSVGFALQTFGFKILNDIAWYKVNPPPNLACRYFTHATETVLWARKNETARHYFDYATMKTENGGKQMQSLWHIKPPATHEKRHGKHPTQKPEALLERILRAASRPGDTVLDPFCGSGTTGVVCARLGRSFVGIDRDADYLTRAIARLEDEISSRSFPVECLPLPLPQPSAFVPAVTIRSLWEIRVASALYRLGGEGHLSEINSVLAEDPNLKNKPTWTCTVRRVIRQYPRFEPVGRGRYRLQAPCTLSL